MRIVVLGASGRIGGAVADVLKNHGHEVVAGARSTGVDAYSGAGLEQAFADADVVVDTTNTGTVDTGEVSEFFGTVARNVQRAAAAAGVRRIVVVSIVGIEAFPTGHFAGKLAQGRAYHEGSVPVRIVRAAQFHEFAEMMLDWTTSDGVAHVPGLLANLVDVGTVAGRLAVAAVDDTAPETVEVVGPQQWNLADAAAKLARRRGNPDRVEQQSADALLPTGELRPGPDAIVAGPTFEEWLDRTYPAR